MIRLSKEFAKPSNIEIIEDPTEEMIEKDVNKADIVVIIHGCRKKKTIQELVDMSKVDPNYQVVYIHFYSKDKKYTIGVKKKHE